MVCEKEMKADSLDLAIGMGHTTKACPEEAPEIGQQSAVKCYNCDEEGHRVRDCPKARIDRFSCRNCR